MHMRSVVLPVTRMPVSICYCPEKEFFHGIVTSLFTWGKPAATELRCSAWNENKIFSIGGILRYFCQDSFPIVMASFTCKSMWDLGPSFRQKNWTVSPLSGDSQCYNVQTHECSGNGKNMKTDAKRRWGQSMWAETRWIWIYLGSWRGSRVVCMLGFMRPLCQLLMLVSLSKRKNNNTKNNEMRYKCT